MTTQLKDIVSRIDIHQFSTVEEARSNAVDFAANTFGQVCPVVLFKQGGRFCASTALPVKLAVKTLTSDSANKKASLEEVKKASNRPIDKEHVKAVALYIENAIKDNSKYILPALTVNALKEQMLFTTKIINNNNFTQLGYLVLSLEDPTLSVTDGQHRLEGLKKALSDLDEEGALKLREDSISIMFSFEDDMVQVHQDFADCSKTKALPKSMIAVYDRRVPANGLILDIISDTALFNDGKTDSTSVSLSKKSNCLVLTNSVRGMLKALMTGQHSMADKAFDIITNKTLSNKMVYKHHLIDFIDTFEAFTEFNSILNKISKLPIGPERQKIAEYRTEYLIANPFGLILACKAVNQYVMIYGNSGKREFIKKLMQDICWKKSSDIWIGNVISEKSGNYAISSTNKPVSNAIMAISNKLGVSLEVQKILI